MKVKNKMLLFLVKPIKKDLPADIVQKLKEGTISKKIT